MIKFIPTFIGISSHPIIIVGEKPDKTRNNSVQALQDCDIGDFINEAISGHKNIILTNIVNLLYKGPFDRNIGVGEGILDLISLVEEYEPKKIIALGEYAFVYASSIKTQCEVINLIYSNQATLLKNELKNDYIKKLRNELDK